MRLLNVCVGTGGVGILVAAGLLMAAGNAEQSSSSAVPDVEKPKYTTEGKLVAPAADVYREWTFIGTPVTPNDLNEGDAAFPEFHNVYINPSAWREWKKSGQFPEGTYIVKELTSVGAKKATSGNGYFQGEFTGLEVSLKDTKKFPAEAKGWGYFSFGHKYPLAKEAAVNQFSSCAQCHVQNAGTDMVFSQYYPALRAAKGK